ncbi:T9SS type A sorting domain-containing protein [Barnesiella intestinihominis]|uniref:T9SS type A sorting domain-containing protein n=1 Tax=Barnesiella intestinihominis TaxID=487174 RepID=UPI003966E6CE
MPVEGLCDREYLIYDFGVKEGETITRFDWITQKSVSSTISKIDTVEIANTLRQRFWTGDKVLWIEGIGVEDGDLLRPGCSTDVSGLDTQDKLVYVKGPDGNIEYETSDAVNDPCYSGIEEVDRDDDIVIIRNGRNLEIAVNDTKFRMIELVDISGRMVWCEYLDGRGKIVLSTADYPRGIYVIVLSSNEDRITRRVIF